ncbi:hypothetical protein B1218_36795, partial [Pseudomonas ogarae]
GGWCCGRYGWHRREDAGSARESGQRRSEEVESTGRRGGKGWRGGGDWPGGGGAVGGQQRNPGEGGGRGGRARALGENGHRFCDTGRQGLAEGTTRAFEHWQRAEGLQTGIDWSGQRVRKRRTGGARLGERMRILALR